MYRTVTSCVYIWLPSYVICKILYLFLQTASRGRTRTASTRGGWARRAGDSSFCLKSPIQHRSLWTRPDPRSATSWNPKCGSIPSLWCRFHQDTNAPSWKGQPKPPDHCPRHRCLSDSNHRGSSDQLVLQRNCFLEFKEAAWLVKYLGVLLAMKFDQVAAKASLSWANPRSQYTVSDEPWDSVAVNR